MPPTHIHTHTVTFQGAVSRGLRCKVCLGLTVGFLESASAAKMGSRAHAAQHYLQNDLMRSHFP